MANTIGMYAHLAGTAVRAGWYYGMYELMNRVNKRLGEPKTKKRPKGPVPSMAELRKEWLGLLWADARNVRDGIYFPLIDDESETVLDQLDRARAMFADLPANMRRRRAGDGAEVARSPQAQRRPDYFVPNFHFQSGGYLTPESARLYDVQVETLFMGAANAMRRQTLRPIAEYVRGRDQRGITVLDVACGTGRLLGQLAQAFPGIAATGVDLSLPSLEEARHHLRERRSVRLVQANGEALPFADATQDVVTSIFLYHELPAPVRRRVTAEIARVLKPGGLFIFIDSLQTGDRPDYDGLLEAFPTRFHEPYYAQYLRDDLDGMFTEVGMQAETDWQAFMSKVVVRRKSEGEARVQAA